jgi:hypothetical protein
VATFTITASISPFEGGKFSVTVVATQAGGGSGRMSTAIVRGNLEAARRCDEIVLATADQLRGEGHEVVVAED